MNYYLNVLKKYAVSNGRATRSEYWYFTLFNLIILIILIVIEGVTGMATESENGVFSNIYQLFILIPSIAVSIRRMHDVNKSGWFMLVPIYNLILSLRDGTKGDNKYGADPKQTVTK
jgi:uncharacterized membrane protein YhaH (DUF805 family)